MLLFFASLALLACLLAAILDTFKPHRFPPGPQWLPFIGSYLEFRKIYKQTGYTHLVWETLQKRYGDLVGVRLGKDRIVIVSGNKKVRQVLTREEFDARPDGFFFRLRSFGKRLGLVFVDGDFFTAQKRFCMKHLRSFGFNQSVMEDRIMMETEDLIDMLKTKNKKPVTMPELLEVNILNNLWALVAGQRFAAGDSRPIELLKYIHTCFRLQDMSGGVLNQMPFLRHFAPEGSSYNQLTTILKSLRDFFQDLVQEHRETIISYDKRDLIDAFLQEMNGTQEKQNTFSEEQLIVLLLDLFSAGAETTGSTLGFAILYLIHFPEIQKKLQDEMDLVTAGIQPRLQDKTRLRYMEAFLLELQRHANVTPTTIAHSAKCDTRIDGHVIPKDTIVIANLYSLHMDQEYWKDPEVFRPERFLDENEKIISHESFLPFGIGKRRCMGEALAKAIMFLFLTALLHNFTIFPVPGEPLPPLEGYDGATISPKPFQCVFSPRHKKTLRNVA